jgi:putative transposase
MDRTVRVKLHPTPEQADTLAETTRLFTRAFNTVCAYGWTHHENNGIRLHHATYYPNKADAQSLVSDLHIQARVKATEAVTSALTLKQHGRTVSAPHAHACPPRYNRHTFKVNWQAQHVRLSTTHGRTTIPFTVPDYALAYTGFPVTTADLIARDGRWWLHIVVQVPAPTVQPSTDVMGVDLGLAQPAVTSTNRFLGQKRWAAVEGRYFRLRRALQKAGTKSAIRHLRHMRHRQTKFRRNCDHVLSKQIVHATPPGSTIVLEDLTNIRQRIKAKRKTANKRRLQSWSFAQLGAFITYKAQDRGCMVAGVPPQHTSQRCSRCGHTARSNRRSRALFVCRACGFTLHADLNGARNIRAKHLADIGRSDAGGLPVTQPLVGEKRASRIYTHKPPASAGGRCLLLTVHEH